MLLLSRQLASTITAWRADRRPLRHHRFSFSRVSRCALRSFRPTWSFRTTVLWHCLRGRDRFLCAGRRRDDCLFPLSARWVYWLQFGVCRHTSSTREFFFCLRCLGIGSSELVAQAHWISLVCVQFTYMDSKSSGDFVAMLFALRASASQAARMVPGLRPAISCVVVHSPADTARWVSSTADDIWAGSGCRSARCVGS